MHGRLLVRPAPPLGGLIEIRGLGIRRLAFEPVAVVGLVVDLAAEDAARLPRGKAATAPLSTGSPCRGLRSQPEWRPLPLVLAALRTPPAGN